MTTNDKQIHADHYEQLLTQVAIGNAVDAGMPQEHQVRLSAELERIDRLPTKEERNRAGQLLIAAVQRGDYGRPSKS